MKTVVLFLTICCYQNKKAILICFLLEDDIVLLIYTTYLKGIFKKKFISKKNFILDNSSINILFKQTPRDIIQLFHDIAWLNLNLEEWKQLCTKTWENEFEYLPIDRFDKVG